MTTQEMRSVISRLRTAGYFGEINGGSGSGFYVEVRKDGNKVTELWDESDVDSFFAGIKAEAVR